MTIRQVATALFALSLPLATGCDGSGLAAPAAAPDATADSGKPSLAGSTTRLFVLDTLAFAPEVPLLDAQGAPVGTSVDGFNLDGLVSDGATLACGELDYTAPDGTPGVDSKISSLLPLFAVAGIGAAEGLLQSTIEEGGILLMLQVDGIDDIANDPDVTTTIRAGFGKPLLATDGRLLPGQTYHLRPDSLDSQAESGRIVDGVLTAGPLNTTLRLRVLGQDYELPVHGAWIRGRFTEDGGLDTGVLGAGVAIDDLRRVGEIAANDDGGVLTSINLLFDGAGDLAPDADGTCQQISATLAFSAVSAYLFDDAAP
jgi:hypothetical protein